MNLIDFKKLSECRRLLGGIEPNCPIEALELEKAKGILDELLELTFFPDCPGVTDQ